MAGIGERPSGLLRVSVPMDFGRLFLGQAIREFLSAAPEVRIDLVYEDREAQLLQEQVDVAIRIGKLQDSSLIGKRLGAACVGCFASSDYLAQYGEPLQPTDLDGHHLLAYSLARDAGQWSFRGNDQEVSLSGRSRFACNNGRALAEAACHGLGIVRIPEFLVQDHLDSGRLVEILKTFRSPPIDISAVYLHRRFKPAKVTALIESLQNYFGRNQDWRPTRAGG
jgi:DNA-binding transcriptional LysR family regulator